MAIVKDLGMVTAYAYAVAGGYEGTEAEFTEMLGQAGITLEQLENLTAVATTLSEGSEATASYSEGVLTFGIPRGNTGATGPQGPQGVQGETGNGIASIAKTATVGLVDTYTITFTDGTTTTFEVTNGADGDITNVAQAFDATKAYSVGDMVLYQGTLYAFTAAHPAGAWVGSDAQAVILADEVTSLKSDLTQTNERFGDVTGNEPIEGWINGKFISTNGSAYNPSGAVDNADFRYVIIGCSEGDKFTISGTGGGNPRLWAFADTNNNILEKSNASATENDLIITAPEDATQLILNDKAKNKDSYYGVILKKFVDDLAAEISVVDLREQENNVSAVKRLQECDGKQFLDKNNFELGNITITALRWDYASSTKRVRTKENYDLELEVGDIIKVKNATKASLYIGYQTSSTTYGAAGWVSEWLCNYGGKYCIVIKELPTENDQTSVDALLGQLEIIKYNNNQQNIKINASHNPSILSANHRGMNRNAPENTLPAFQQSKQYGFDYVETDIVWTSDGVPVLLHDASINRTARNTDGTEITDTVNIADITYAQALEYDFGIWKASKWAGTKIPTFEQLLIQCKKQGIKILAEVKTYGYTSNRLTALLDLVKSTGAEKLVMWISFEASLLNTIKNINDKAKLGLLSANVNSTVLATVQSLKTDNNIVVLMSNTYTSEAVDLCIDANIPLWAYTINNKNTLNALPMYLCGVTSDLYAVNVEWANV